MKSNQKSKNYLKLTSKTIRYVKKIEKLKEINESVAKRCAELETYMFVENIVEVPVHVNTDNTQQQIVETK